MRKRLDEQIACYEVKERFWLSAYGETGNENFLKRAEKLKKKIEVLKSYRGVLPGLSLKQINDYQARAHALVEKELFSKQPDLFKLVFTI